MSAEAATPQQLTALELAVLKQGLSLDTALRNTAVIQIGRVVEALEAETTRLLEQTAALEPLDTAAALRIGKTWRQILPLALRLQAQDPSPPSAAAAVAVRPSLAALIAAEENEDDPE